MTAADDISEARRVLLEEALLVLPFLGEGPLVDVGSGSGSPGIPVAVSRPDLDVVLLESNRRKCAFLGEMTAGLENVSVLCARSEEHAVGAGRESYGTALARALAAPPVAAELCLPLVRTGGAAILFASPTADLDGVARAASSLAAKVEESPAGFIVLRKTGPTPERFPRRSGMAKKRPLA
jgi:16S rRNA (guanine527-N7)-methyltransferase